MADTTPQTKSLSHMTRMPKHAMESVPLLRQARVQIGLFVIFAFSTLGPYNGLNALGGGGLTDHLLATKLNCVYALTLSIFGWLGGACYNFFGCRVVCSVASLCYSSYVLVLILITFVNASELLVFPSGCLLGIGASLLWASFGATSIRYPLADEQPRTFALMWCLTNLGGFVCGILSLVINFNADKGAEANLGSYATLSCLAAIGALVAIFGLRNQNKVIRSDGERVAARNTQSLSETVYSALCVFKDPKIRPLWPIFMAPFAHMPFLFNGLNGKFFNIRSRSLNSSLYWFFRVPGGLLFFLVARDPTHSNDSACRARRLTAGLYLTFTWAALCLTFSHFSIFNSFGTTPPPLHSHHRIDFWHDWPRSLLPIIPFAAFGTLDALVQSLLYNLLGFLAGGDSRTSALYSGFYKTWQSMTVGLMWGIDWTLTIHEERLSYASRYQLHWWMMAISWLAALPGTLQHLLKLREMPDLKPSPLAITSTNSS